MGLIVPTWAYAAGGLALAVAGFGAGWTAQGWHRDSGALKQVQATAKDLQKQTDRIDAAAATYEQSRQDAGVRSETRTNEIRTIYKDRPVSADCAAPDAVRSVLDDAVADANARASGEPAPAVSAGSGAAKPAP
ncbi:hypothetical protein [Novosphingobium sp. 9]|uniref:hypothetical protein n=1 Tax=Novosphingobium sp. 9 TaxID=2025349 RepID=UPI0021B59E80|nr:hypothetical protein [Novosphingobium sp. 9]